MATGSITRDVTLAFRVLLRRPSLTIAALLSLTLGIGANCAVFRIVNAAFLRPLGVTAPATIFSVFVTNPANSQLYLPVSYPNYEDLARQTRAFSGLAAYQWLRPTLLQGDKPRKIYAQVVTENFFEVMGIQAVLGRVFSRQDGAAAGGSPVAVLSHNFWQRELGGDPQVLGKTIHLGRQAFTVVGVAPRGFKGTKTFTSSNLWVPISMYRQVSPYARYFDTRGAQMFEMVGRLRPGFSPRQAEAEMKTLALRLEREHPDINQGESLLLLPFVQASIEPWRRPVFVRAGAVSLVVVGLLLLIACGNVASLLLSRNLEQRKEIAIRLSLGARRGQLIRQLVVQSLLLSLGGSVLGLLLGLRGPDLLWRFRPPEVFTADALDFGVDGRVVFFTITLSIAAALLFGAAPALRFTRPDLVTVLQEAVPAGALVPRKLSMRDLLIVAQVALCFLSLTGAGLFLKSLYRTGRVSPGFDADNILVMTYTLSEAGTPGDHQRILEKLRDLPGVEEAALATLEPLSTDPQIYWNVRLAGGGSAHPREGVLILTNVVTPSYFSTLGIPVLRGRGLSEGDREQTRPVAVVNETMAGRLWPGRDPIGQRFQAEDHEIEVVGVAADSKYVSLREPPQAFFYVPLAQWLRPEVILHLRTAGRPETLREQVRRELRSLDPDLAPYDVHTMRDTLSTSLWAQRLGATLLTLFGLLALALAVTGIYSVLSYSVHQRRQEVGVRMALGALPGEVVRLLVGRAMGVVTLGLLVGLAAATAAGRLVANLLYGIRPTDPVTFVQIGGALAAVAFAASYTTARQAVRVDPAQALRPGSSFQ
jgi:predicted permease